MLKRLHGVIKTVSQRRNQFWKGWEGKIVIDEVNDKFIQGRNYAYKPIVIEKKSIDQKLKKSQFLGAILRVKVIEISNFSLKGSILK